MNKTQPPENKSDATAVDKAYESSLEKALHQSKEDDTSIHQILDDDLKSPSLLYSDEISKIRRSIKRDLIDAAHHMSETGKELKDWLIQMVRADKEA